MRLYSHNHRVRKRSLLWHVLAAVLLALSPVLLLTQTAVNAADELPDHSFGYQFGKFALGQNPSKVSASSDGTVYIYDSTGGRITRVDTSGAVLERFSDTNIADGISALAVAPDGTVYVVKGLNVYAYTASGTPVTSAYSVDGYISNFALAENGLMYATLGNTVVAYNTLGGRSFSWGANGSSDGQFNSPQGIAIYNNEVYVADRLNNRIQAFDLDGTFLRKWDADNASYIGIAVDGTVLVGRATTGGAGLVYAYTNTGTFLSAFAPYSSNPNTSDNSALNGLVSMAVDTAGNVYAIDGAASMRGVRRFDSSHEFQSAVHVSIDDPKYSFYSPSSITYGADGNLYIYDNGQAPGLADGSGRILKYNSSGDYLETIIIRNQSFDSTYSNGYSLDSEATLTIDNEGNIYFTGPNYFVQDGVGSRYFVAAYSPSGGEPSFFAELSDELNIQVTSSQFDGVTRSLFVSGNIQNQTDNSRYLAIKYDIAGDELSLLGRQEMLSKYNPVSAYITVGGDGRLYYTGRLDGCNWSMCGSDQIWSVWSTDKNGQDIQEHVLYETDIDGVRRVINGTGISTDRNGILYISGVSETIAGENHNYAVASFNVTTGEFEPVAPIGSEEEDLQNSVDARRMTSDLYGNVYVLDVDVAAVKVYTVNADAPSAPRSLAANSDGVTSISISWEQPEQDGNAPITNYIVRARVVGGGWVEVATLGSAARSYVLSSLNGAPLKASVNYEIAVLARNSAGDSPSANLTIGMKNTTVVGDNNGASNLAATGVDVTLLIAAAVLLVLGGATALLVRVRMSKALS